MYSWCQQIKKQRLCIRNYWRKFEAYSEIQLKLIVGTCKSSSITSSIVIMPTATSSSGSFGSASPSISRMSEYMSLDHFLLLDPLLCEIFPLLGKLFHLFSDLLLFKIFSWRGFSPSMSTFTSFTGPVERSKDRLKGKKQQMEILSVGKFFKAFYSRNQGLLSAVLPLGCSSVLHRLITIAMWLWPFWNSFSMSYNGNVSLTLSDK